MENVILCARKVILADLAAFLFSARVREKWRSFPRENFSILNIRNYIVLKDELYIHTV